MEIWILTLLALRPKYVDIAQMYEKRAEDEALNLCAEVMQVYEKVGALNDIKRRAVNAKVLCDRAARALGEELYLVEKYLTSSASQMADEAGCTRLKIHRALKKAMARAAKTLYKLGFDENAMKRDYADIPIFARTYARLKRLKTKERDAEKVALAKAQIPTEAPLAAAAV